MKSLKQLKVYSTRNLRSFGSVREFIPNQNGCNLTRVVCVDIKNDACVNEFLQRGHTVYNVKRPTKSELRKIIHDCDSLFVGGNSRIKIDNDIFSHATNLKVIGLPEPQSSSVDVTSATKHGILVLTPKLREGHESMSEAELTMSLLLNLSRRIPESTMEVKSGLIDREKLMGIELRGKNIGIIGIGSTGKSVAKLSQYLGLRVYGYDPKMSKEAAESNGITKCSLKKLYSISDFLSFHVPLTERTRNLFEESALLSCRDGVKIIMPSLDVGILDKSTVLMGIKSGRIGGVACDSLSTPLDETSLEILRHRNSIVTPHLGDSSDESTNRAYKDCVRQVSDALLNRSFRGIENAAYMPLTLLPEMNPFIELGSSIGKLLAQLLPKDDRIVKISTSTLGGHDINITTPRARGLLQVAIVKSLIDTIHPNPYKGIRSSLVNANSIALAMGIRVQFSESRNSSPLKNTVSATVTTTKGNECIIVGSVFGEEPRIVQVDNYRDFPAFKPEGTLLFFNNEDRPGAIADILDILSAARINVANLGLARNSKSRNAFCILTLDEELPHDIFEKLKGLETLGHVRIAHMGGIHLLDHH